MYYDESELGEELTGLKSELEGSRATALSDYDTRSEVDGKVTSGIEGFQDDVMVPTLNAMRGAMVSNEALDARLGLYSETTAIDGLIGAALGSYVTGSELSNELLNYASKDYLENKYYVRLNDDYSLDLNTTGMRVTGNMEMIGGINLNGDISATSFSGDGSQITGVSASSVDWEC